jgi:hypothetical protein
VTWDKGIETAVRDNGMETAATMQKEGRDRNWEGQINGDRD